MGFANRSTHPTLQVISHPGASMTIDPRVAREIVIFFRQACLLVLLVPVAGIAWIAMSITWSVLATDHFYRVRPILQAMRDAGEGATENSPSAREALSRHVPIGTDAATAVADLAGEGFGCAKQPPSSEARVVCRLRGPTVLGGWTDWTVELHFDESGHLSWANVAIWNVFL